MHADHQLDVVASGEVPDRGAHPVEHPGKGVAGKVQMRIPGDVGEKRDDRQVAAEAECRRDRRERRRRVAIEVAPVRGTLPAAPAVAAEPAAATVEGERRAEAHTSEQQSTMRSTYT